MASTRKLSASTIILNADKKDSSSNLVIPFVSRQQELDIVVRKISSGTLIADSEAQKFSLELKNFHTSSLSSLIETLNSNKDTGLSTEVAVNLLKENGPNNILKPKELPMFVKFLLCFFSGFCPLLWLAAFFTFLSWEPFGTPPSNQYNLALSLLLIIIIVAAGFFTFYQEVQTSLALANFRTLIPDNCLVLRDRATVSLSASQLVVGDIVFYQAGSRVPADSRVISSTSLEVDKSMLTGESEPVKLVSQVAKAEVDRSYLQSSNIALMGCTVVAGDGVGIVVATGKDAQISKISESLSSTTQKLSSLQIDINKFVVIIGSFALVFTTVVVCVWAGYLNVQHNGFMTPSIMIANAIGVLVALVPQGLPLALLTGLTIIAQRLCRKHFVQVRQLSTIETLGSMSLLASDKTGTLTQNLMTVTSIITNKSLGLPENKTTEVGAVVASYHRDFQDIFFVGAVLCNQSKIDMHPAAGAKIQALGGNGVDRALLEWAATEPEYLEKIKTGYNVKCTLPFSSVTKLAAAVVYNINTEQTIVLVKGAPEYIISKCTHYYSTDGELRELTQEYLHAMQVAVDDRANKGERVIALACLPLSKTEYPPTYMFSTDPEPNFPVTGLALVACVAVSDPPRPQVRQSVIDLRGAGILVAMVTGDAPVTAEAIARQVGIIDVNDIVYKYSNTNLQPYGGSYDKRIDSSVLDVENKGHLEMDTFTQKAQAVLIEGKYLADITPAGWNCIFSYQQMVFARTTPEQKLQIVMEGQARGHLVGVTGDGVNDAPALKRANIGIAMNGGSDVAKDAAEMILLTNDFSSIVKGVEEGRVVFENIRKVIAYQIAGGCFSELIPVLATFFVGVPSALTGLLAVIICVLGDTFAGIALTTEPSESFVMKKKPRNTKTEPLVTVKLVCYSYLFYGVLTSIFSFYIYFTYMTERGDTRAVPDPVPADDDGQRMFPAGYRSGQLVGAWNWGSDSGNLGNDNNLAATVGASVTFVALGVCNWGHFLSIRRKTPYFSDSIMNTMHSLDPWYIRLWNEIIESKPRWQVVLALSLAALDMNFFIYTPTVQTACGTLGVPGRYWGMAIGFSMLIFFIAELRKWFILLFPENPVTKAIAW